MKQNILLLLLIISVFSAKAIETDGYFITQSGDTVVTKIVLSKFLGEVNTLFPKVEVKDTTTGTIQKFKPGDIKGFGFIYKNEKHDFVSRNFEDKPAFFEVRRKDARLNLYSALYGTGGGQNSYTALKCVLEKPDGSFLLLPGTESSKKTKAKLKEFFAEPEVQQQIDNSFMSRDMFENDVLKLVDSINSK